jgi:hypothetical protein
MMLLLTITDLIQCGGEGFWLGLACANPHLVMKFTKSTSEVPLLATKVWEIDGQTGRINLKNLAT